MPEKSLFAKKLRTWRTENGVHGRMTQEALAELLGVSIDAIGKYERSVSYIRGDLEHRLKERLGWSHSDILACREDWEIKRPEVSSSKYRLLGQDIVDELFGSSWETAIRRKMELAQEEFATLPNEFAATVEVFLPIYLGHMDQWSAVLHDGDFVGKWVVLLLRPECEIRFKQGKFIEAKLTVDDIHRPILPGLYFGYCPAVIVRSGHEACSVPLLASFLNFLEQLAEREIFLNGIGTTSVSTKGAQLCQDLGMVSLGVHDQFPEYENWLLRGDSIARSIFGRRSAKVRSGYERFYAEHMK